MTSREGAKPAKRILLGALCALAVLPLLLHASGPGGFSTDREGSVPSEAFFVQQLCAVLGGEQKTLPDRTQVDCLTQSLAIEVDWASKLWEAVGQSKWYAQQTGKRPGILLLIREDQGVRWAERARKLCEAEEIVLFVRDVRPTDPFGGPSPWADSQPSTLNPRPPHE